MEIPGVNLSRLDWKATRPQGAAPPLLDQWQSSQSGWAPTRPVASATPESGRPSTPSLASTAHQAALRAGGSLVSWLLPSEARVDPEETARRSRKSDTVLHGLEQLFEQHPQGRKAEAELADIRAGKETYLSFGTGLCYKVLNLDEAQFFLFMRGLCGPEDLDRPELARSLKWLSEQRTGLNRDSVSELPLSNYRELQQPESEVTVQTGKWSHGKFKGAELEPFDAFRAGIEPSLKAAALLEKRLGSGKDPAWELIHNPTLQHAGADLETRARVAVACHNLRQPEPAYEKLLELAGREPLDPLLESFKEFSVKTGPEAARALELSQNQPPKRFSEIQSRVKDLDLAMGLARLAQEPSKAADLDRLLDFVMRTDLREAMLSSWLAASGKVELEASLDLLSKNRDYGAIIHRMWREVPQVDQTTFLKLAVHQDLPYETVHRAYRSVQQGPPEQIPTRLETWESWYENLRGDQLDRVESASFLLESWQGPLAQDGPDFARVIDSSGGDWKKARELWSQLKELPSRDLGLASLQSLKSHQSDEVARLAALGFDEPERAAGLRFLVEKGVPLEAGLEAVSLLQGGEAPLVELLKDYLKIRNQVESLPNADTLTRAAMRQALDLSPTAPRALALATEASWGLTTGLELLPLLEQGDRAERLANLECAGWLAARDQGRRQQTGQYLRLLVAAEVGAEGRQALLTTLKEARLSEVEDFLGLQAGPAESAVARLGKAAGLLARTRPAPEAALEVARRMGPGDWSQEAAVLVALGDQAGEIARQLGSLEALKIAAPTLGGLAGRGKDTARAWQVLSTPVGQESLAERCKLTLGWLKAHPGELDEAVKDYSAATARLAPDESLEQRLESAGRLRSMLSSSDFGKVVAELDARARRKLGPSHLSEGLEAFTAAASRLGLFGELDADAVLQEMKTPSARPAGPRAGGIEEKGNQLTLPGVRLRKRL